MRPGAVILGAAYKQRSGVINIGRTVNIDTSKASPVQTTIRKGDESRMRIVGGIVGPSQEGATQVISQRERIIKYDPPAAL